MSTTMAGLHMRHRLLLVLLVCLALPLVGGCSSDPECLGFDEHLAENIRLGSEERFNERAFCFENNYLES
jgi:hypothetical protein